MSEPFHSLFFPFSIFSLGTNQLIIFFFESNRTVKKQLCFILGRHRAFSIEEENEDLLNLMGNDKLSSHYRQLARDLSVEEAKAPKDVYKMHLIENRHC